MLLAERRWLYSNWLVRWPRVIADIPHIDFLDKKTWGYLLDDWESDTDFLQECVREARVYVSKDRELIYTKRIPHCYVDWWCEHTHQWRNVAKTPKPQSWCRLHVDATSTAHPAAKRQIRLPPAAQNQEVRSEAKSSQAEAKSSPASIR